MISYIEDLRNKNIVIPDITNKNSNTLKESYNQKHFPDFYQYVIENTPKDLLFKEKLYWIINNIHTRPVCITCGKNVRFVSFGEGYKKFCSGPCVSKNEQTKKEVKERNIKKYGVDNPGKLQSSIEKSKQTKLERYGDPFYHDDKKRKKTNLERYGDENFTNREKAQKTNLKKYGVKYGFASDTIKNKIKQTNIEKYGCENPMSNENIRNKSLNSNHNKKILEIPELIAYCNDGKWICKCTNTSCDLCKDKQYIISRPVYYIRKKINIEPCTILNPVVDIKIKNTSIEIFIKQILDKYNINYDTNVRNIISPKEIDIYIPEKNIAIECNGVFWHSDQNKPQKYHYDKYKLCLDNKIQLISIWEDQIVNNPEKIESIMLSKLGIYDKRIYARNCIIKEVSSKECNEFLDEYHLQGKTNSSIRLGLYYNDELISVITFGKGRKCLNSKTNYELYRYCCKNNIQIIGGASKLFKYFLKIYNPEYIESFSSNDISNGNLYKQLGFEKVSDSIGYWYVDKEMNRYHRYKFTKYSLVREGYDKDKTEFEIMDERGFYRIYDSGQTKWVYKNRKS